MTVKELADEHLKKSAAHHDALAQHHGKISKCHKDAASSHSDQTVAQAHRDLAEHHETIAKAHAQRGEDFEALRQSLAEVSGAEVFDSHESETREMHSVRSVAGRDDFLKRTGVLQD
jgi:hypothetical protein